MKKYFFLLLVLIGGALPAAAFGATVSVSPAAGTYQVGNTITAQIVVDTQGVPVEGVDVRYLHYDPAVLAVQDENSSVAGAQITPGTLMPNTVVNTVDPSAGSIAFLQVISGNTTFTGSGVLATVRFTALAPGNVVVAFDFTQGNTADTNVASGGADVLVAVTNAAYTLNALPPQHLAPIVYLSPASAAKTTGESFPLTIMLDTRSSEIDGADVVLSYNRTLVKAVDADSQTTGAQITPGTLMPNTAANDVSESIGRITFSQMTSANSTFSGSGALATITLRAIAPGAANFTFSYTKGRTDDTNVSLAGADLLDAVTNATVQIVENGVAPTVTNTKPSGVIALASSVTLALSTDETATYKYGSAPGTDYAVMTRYFSSQDGVEHSATLYSGFQAGQNAFYVRCRDRSGSTMNTDAIISFFITTDTAAPFITQPLPLGSFFLPKNIQLSVVTQDQSGVASCKYSLVPNTDYTMMSRSLSPRPLVPPSTEQAFSAFVYTYDLHTGQNTMYVRCKDKAGNVNASDSPISFTLFAPPTFMVGVEGSNNASAHKFTISLLAPGTTTEIAYVTTQPSGTGAIVFLTDNTSANMLISPGNYDVRIVSDKYLQKKLANVSIGGGAVIIIPSLLAGDLNGDGVINLLDWSIMDTQWTKMFSVADINRDGKVNTLDWGYLRKNWLQAGN